MQFFYSRETRAIGRQTWRLILLANQRISGMRDTNWTVVGRGYFSHASSHSENVAPADNRQELQPQNESVIH